MNTGNGSIGRSSMVGNTSEGQLGRSRSQLGQDGAPRRRGTRGRGYRDIFVEGRRDKVVEFLKRECRDPRGVHRNKRMESKTRSAPASNISDDSRLSSP